LNAEDEEAAGGEVGAGLDGIERSRRSPMPEEGAGLYAGAGAGEVMEEKPPKPLKSVGGLVALFCAAGDLGFESKKFPPPPNKSEEAGGGDFLAEKRSRPEKGEGVGFGLAAGCVKERLLKASFMPPKDDCEGDFCEACVGDDRPPNESCRACC
jgi:hypothetical protein